MQIAILQFKRTKGYRQDVSGESHYQETLADIMESEDGLTEVDLHLEDFNKFDPNSVAVVYGTETVGYLPSAAAVSYRAAIKALGHPQAIGTCAAKVTGGGEGRSYGIVLDLDLYDLQIENIKLMESPLPSAKPAASPIPSPPISTPNKIWNWFFAPSRSRIWRIAVLILLAFSTCCVCLAIFGAIVGTPQ